MLVNSVAHLAISNAGKAGGLISGLNFSLLLFLPGSYQLRPSEFEKNDGPCQLLDFPEPALLAPLFFCQSYALAKLVEIFPAGIVVTIFLATVAQWLEGICEQF